MATELFFVFFRREKNKHNGASYLFSFIYYKTIIFRHCRIIIRAYPLPVEGRTILPKLSGFLLRCVQIAPTIAYASPNAWRGKKTSNHKIFKEPN